MGFFLFLTLLNFTKTHTIPQPFYPYDNKDIEYYFFKNDTDDAMLFYDDIIDINSYCQCDLYSAEYEYLNAKQCQQLVNWIDSRLNNIADKRYKDLLIVLKGFAKRAVNLNTGIGIQI